MSYTSRKGCFKCGNLGHIAEACSSEQRLCYNCRQPGHESAACPQPRTVAAKQCYSCGGVGHIQAECPSLRVQGGGQKCYACGRFGHIARVCPNGGAGFGGGPGQGSFASRAPPPGRGLNTASLPPVKCFKCGGLNHMSRSVLLCIFLYFAWVNHLAADRDCLAPPGGGGVGHKDKICYKCSQPGHVSQIRYTYSTI
ncbi:hypothetical protein M422DRAFT_149881 [Sphaerobolus stellatus SS14]|nr:hypothetical protein M422DRAFT_149881 [Sphaerobolus stellatus SS14]